MSHIVGDFRPGGDGFDKPEFILSVLIASILVLFTGFFFGEDIAKAVTEFVEKEAAAAAPAPESVRPRDYTELALGDEHLKKFRLELRGSNRNSGLLILDSRATDFRMETVPPVGLDFIEYPGGKRTSLSQDDPPGDPFDLWGKMNPGGSKQFFFLEAKGDCTVTFIVSKR